MFKSKRKGNMFENKVAKELSEWMFGDKTSIIRSITSGALKNELSKYNGDLIPVGNTVFTKFKKFPFLIECKNGYLDRIPTLFNGQTIIKEWFNKCVQEQTEEQNIIFLICKFGKYKPLLFTNTRLLIDPEVILHNNGYYILSYDYKTLLSYEFNTVFQKQTISTFLKSE
jgi:hypothetical protein